MILEAIGTDATKALVAGTIDARTETHITHTPLLVDEQGFKEINDLLTEAQARASEIQEEAASRLADGKEDGIPTKLGIVFFESPGADAK